MRKPFHTFISEDRDFQNNIFYSGALNSSIKSMILQNVRNLFEENRPDSGATKKVYLMSEELLKTLSDISRKEKSRKNKPVLFNLQKNDNGFILNFGIVVSRSESAIVKLLLEKLLTQPSDETRKKFFDKIREDHKSDESMIPILSLLNSTIKNNRSFGYALDEFSENELFLIMNFEVESKNDRG
jgi:hypothetical protein